MNLKGFLELYRVLLIMMLAKRAASATRSVVSASGSFDGHEPTLTRRRDISVKSAKIVGQRDRLDMNTTNTNVVVIHNFEEE